jgi:hypothetical protein
MYSEIASLVSQEDMALLPGYNCMPGYKFRMYPGNWAETHMLIRIEQP